jgi:5'-nucleotidase
MLSLNRCRFKAALVLLFSLSLGFSSAYADPSALPVSLPAAQPSALTAPQKAPLLHITLLHVNDVYELSPSQESNLGGLARLATLIKVVRKENPNTLFVFSGDTLSPSLGSHIFHGKQMIDLWNQLGLDVAVLGNHEFDFGPVLLKQRVKESHFPWLAANVIDHQTGKPFNGLPAYVVKDVGGVKLGFLGLLTVDTATTSSPGPALHFEDPVKTTLEQLPKMKQDGANVLVGLTHLDISEDQRVAGSVPLQLALILGGHEHTLTQSMAGGTTILKMNSDATQMSRVDLYVDPVTKALHHMFWEVIPVNGKVVEDPSTAALVAHYEQQINQSMGEVLGKSTVELDAHQHLVRRQESALGNFIADSFRGALKADVALINAGSIRSNTSYKPGPITLSTVMKWLPFEDKMVRIQLSGSELKAALENGVSEAGASESGSFPVISGMRFRYNEALPIGQRVLQVEVNGQPLDLKKQYTLATSHYLSEGKSGYVMFKPVSSKALAASPLDSDVIAQVIRTQKQIAPRVDGRIMPVLAP